MRIVTSTSAATAGSAISISAPAAAMGRSRMPLVDALRAFAASMIAWHHFAYYPPLADWAAPVMGDLIEWLRDYSRSAQVFFVIAGYVMAQSALRHHWEQKPATRFLLHRFCRLGLPYLAAVITAMGACFLARGSLDESVLGPPPTWDQVLANATFTQFILGYDSLSAGLWFVCINFQLSLLYLAVLYLGSWIAPAADSASRKRSHRASMGLGWALAALSMFYFNLDVQRWDMWAVYFFAQFFLGVMVHEALQSARGRVWFGVYVLMLAAAMAYQWRWRLVTALATGMILFLGGALGFGSRWPQSRIIAYLGRTSYSLFLIHFPVLIVVATVWSHLEWSSPDLAAMGLFTAYVASLAASALFFRYVESPAARLSRRFA